MDGSGAAIFESKKKPVCEDSGKWINNHHNKNHTSNTAQSLLDLILNFLSTSSNEVLFLTLLFSTAATFIIFGRVGLLLIGLTLGVILHASWQEAQNTTERKRNMALLRPRRFIDWPERNHTENGSFPIRKTTGILKIDLDYSTFQPATAAALKSLTDAIIDNYVRVWYGQILPSEPTFPLSCQKTLTHFITSVSSHLSRKRTADAFLQFLTNSSSILIIFLHEFSEAFECFGNSTSPEYTIKRYLELFPDSNLANVLEFEQQRKKLDVAANDILSNFLDPNVSGCYILKDFLREIFSGAVLETTISSLSRPESINSWIIYILRDGESEIMNAIDAGVEGARNQSAAISNTANGTSNLTSLLGKDNGFDKQSSSKPESPDHKDKTADVATIETRRLSDMIPAQDALRQDSTQGLRDSRRISVLSSNSIPVATQPLSETEAVGCSISMLRNNNENRITKQTTTRSNFVSDKRPEPVDARLSQIRSAPAEESQLRSLVSHGTSPLTLFGASVSVDDGSEPGEKGIIRSKPSWDYLLQIEPMSSNRSGWMVFRKYADFESLHETLAIISRLNRIHGFSDRYPILPPWKGQAKHALARSLERYLQDALQYELFAESGKMKRFLEKDESLAVGSTGASTKSGFLFPSQNAFENVGKSVLDVLTSAPKGVAGGSKAVLDGVSGVFGSVAGTGKKPFSQSAGSNSQSSRNSPAPSEKSHAGLKDLQHHKTVVLDRDTKNLSSSSPITDGFQDSCFNSHFDNTSSDTGTPREEQPNRSSDRGRTLEMLDEEAVRDIGSNATLEEPDPFQAPGESETQEDIPSHSPSFGTKAEVLCAPTGAGDAEQTLNSPITREETQIAVELIFAVINELYSSSSAWNIRRTILNAAKSYILRPGSPHLETIRVLLQNSMIDTHTSDEALGGYLVKLCETVFPTQADCDLPPSARTDAEKKRLRETARKIFVQKGLPQAVISVMGATASREALERIFDCLQVEPIARGLVFSLLLQALKVVTL